MKRALYLLIYSLSFGFMACEPTKEELAVQVFETSAAGNSWASINPGTTGKANVTLNLDPAKPFRPSPALEELLPNLPPTW